MKLPTISVNEWLEAEREFRGPLRSRPEGSKTANEYATEKGIAPSTARVTLLQMARKGVLDSQMFYNGRSMEKCYFPKKKALPAKNRNGRLSNGAAGKLRSAKKG